MELKDKLQELRKNIGFTQEELARALYVSRTAISKWESGRGYPSIDSLKEIAKFFNVTIDELLSGEQLLTLAEESNKQTKKHFRDLVFGLLDLSVALLLFLPFFAVRTGSEIISVSLTALYGVQPYLKIVYCVMVGLVAITGILTLALQRYSPLIWVKSKAIISIILGGILVVLFIISLQPYASIFAFVLLAIKALLLTKWQ
ncbi:MAG: helix-turn-helix transcriptional regulator [Clostridia bacterium]|nr:helix-turn-helix transcriptional regulator [Clostridia bacterium]